MSNELVVQVEPFAFTLDQVALLTGMTERRLEEGCARGEIPHTKYRGRTVMTREHITAFLRQFEVVSPPEHVDGGDDLQQQRIAQAKARTARRYGWAAMS